MKNWNEYYKNSISESPSLILEKFFDLGFEKDIHKKNAIDLGCGAGNDTVFLLRKGYTVISVDKEPIVVDIIENRIPAHSKIEFIIDKFGTMELPSTNLIIANFSIPFCSPKFFDGLCKKITESIANGGYFCRKFSRRGR